ncbi:hypothetical protein H7J71_02470 [Mycolicibacterium peregrinum]|uniref:hypothetical protein n=1 Tax=Mycolicibacterium peregrinum TaxID=43304 RepID=UPI000A157A82|nr:hypothetical protein [Mycolicibacterium peregrinum]MCV7200875.1 hypothetical protein [Mycolicibacterium peregrinum]ORW50996.1 hypothetical protein AWC21_32225 [Mycolicibacterium peregrinum]
MGKQRPCLAGLMAAIGITAMYRGRIRPWMYTWGADPDELTAVFPGDELVRAGAPRTTRALTIHAPVNAVWPWLAQIGEDRGGFYSHALLERAVGARIHNAGRIHPEWQDLHVGDSIWLARRYGDDARQIVAVVEPHSHLVLTSPADFDRLQRGGTASGAWGFYLRRSGGKTRLIARGSGRLVGTPWFDVAHFVMERKMMCGIRDRAEQTPPVASSLHRESEFEHQQIGSHVSTIS